MGVYERQRPYTKFNPSVDDREEFAQFLESVAKYIREHELTWIDGRVVHAWATGDLVSEMPTPVEVALVREVENEMTFYIASRRDY